MVADVTEQVAEQIGTLYRENAPEFVYFLTLLTQWGIALHMANT